MKVRFDFTEGVNLERALHDTLLEFNGDLADCMVAVAANADITFKPCQLSSPEQKALEREQAAIEVGLPEFLRLLCGMVQIIDGQVSIMRSRSEPQTILDLRVVDSSFALVETEDKKVLQAFAARLGGQRRT
jgi:hypothetical protein